MKTEVLIIGGGFAGVTAAQALQKQGIQTLLIDRKDYFEVTYAVLRDVAAPSKHNGQARKQYHALLSGQFIQATVTELLPAKALLCDGRQVQFDKVIIASGSRYSSLPLAKSDNALSLTQRRDELERYHTELKAASQVLIIGGGVVGVELAGELAYAMPHLNIILAHKNGDLLDGFKLKARRKALHQLEQAGVEVRLNADYQAINDGYQDRNSGRLLTPDRVFLATGTRPNNDFLKPSLSHILNDQGLVKVDDYLQVVGSQNAFALGDIADVGEAKLGYLAVEQGKYLADFITQQYCEKRIKAYKRHPFMALVPTGQKTGVVQLPFMVSSCKALVNLKQKDLFISKTFKAFST